MRYADERRVAIDAVLRACGLCRAVRKALVSESTLAKRDRSPVTVADYGAQAVINACLTAAFPDDSIIAEEDASALRSGEGAGVKAAVVHHVNAVLGEMSERSVLAAIDAGGSDGGPKGRHWCLDPIDGTKGFLRGDQYAVALALIEDGEVVLGVLGCPNLPLDAGRPDGAKGALFVGVRGEGAFVRSFAGDDERRISVTGVTDPAQASFCESVESGHSSHGDSARVAGLLGVSAAPVRVDSQCKYAVVARGEASIYLRLPTRADYEEKIWDHAAGWMIVKEAGGEVTDIHGEALDFSLGRTLRRNKGVITTNGRLHGRVIEAVREVLG